jgi:hypothetical protein
MIGEGGKNSAQLAVQFNVQVVLTATKRSGAEKTRRRNGQKDGVSEWDDEEFYLSLALVAPRPSLRKGQSH